MIYYVDRVVYDQRVGDRAKFRFLVDWDLEQQIT